MINELTIEGRQANEELEFSFDRDGFGVYVEMAVAKVAGKDQIESGYFAPSVEECRDLRDLLDEFLTREDSK